MQGEQVDDFRPKTASDLTDMALAYRASQLAEAFRGRLPTLAELRDVTQELGIEIATALFLRTLQDSDQHGSFTRTVNAFDFADWDTLEARAARVEVCVVASNLFQSGRPWGDHVEEWRGWARDLGFITEVIDTDQRASVAANARTILDYLTHAPRRRRILVTYGQGATEFRYLLHRRANGMSGEGSSPLPEGLSQVRAWINVCGAFAGSSSSRYFQENRLRRILARLRMKVASRNPLTLAETSATFPMWRRPVSFPPGMLVANIVGVPTRAQMQKMQGAQTGAGSTYRFLYSELAKECPNDGVVNVIEACAPSGPIFPVPGMSHHADRLKLEPVLKRVIGHIGSIVISQTEVKSDREQPSPHAFVQSNSQIPRRR